MKPDPTQVKQFIEAYAAEEPIYRAYAEVLAAVLNRVLKMLAPTAIVQSRAKSVSSFAEKVMRKAEGDPLRRFTDLCGARVITTTTAEALAVGGWIAKHFVIDKINSVNKSQQLAAREFGYRSVHYIVQINRPELLGVPIPPEIGERKAEIQVRTLLEHAYADFDHDIGYKSHFKIPDKWKRITGRAAALLEETDEALGAVVRELTLYTRHFGDYMTRPQIDEEVKIQKTLLDCEKDECDRMAVALRLARLLKSIFNWRGIIEAASPFAGKMTTGAVSLCRDRAELMVEYGNALCRLHAPEERGERPANPTPADGVEDGGFQRGQEVLKAAVELAEGQVQTRARVCLAWSYEQQEGQGVSARDKYKEAFEADPNDPFVLASYLEFEMHCRQNDDFTPMFRPLILQAIRTCEDHVSAGVELPWAFFTMGKLYLMLCETDPKASAGGKNREAFKTDPDDPSVLAPYKALAGYLKGIALCLGGTCCVPEDALEEQRRLLRRGYLGKRLPDHRRWVDTVLLIADSVRTPQGKSMKTLSGLRRRKSPFEGPVVIVGGGTDESVQSKMEEYRHEVLGAFRDFHGTVISGGTRAGIPGIIGELAEVSSGKSDHPILVIGYLPAPEQIEKDPRYHEIIRTEGNDFTVDQSIQNWIDLIASGYPPSEVMVLGVNGGKIAAFEYRLALAMGATVGVVRGSGRAAEEIQMESAHWGPSRLLILPDDPMTMRMFVCPGKTSIDPKTVEAMAERIHNQFLSESRHKYPESSMAPWPYLRADFKESNRKQAATMEEILRTERYEVVENSDAGDAVLAFGPDAVERMAEMEHARWNLERLRSGWKFGIQRDDAEKIHPDLVPWRELPDPIREYDKKAVKEFPRRLAEVGLKIVHSGTTAGAV
jgi:ppGpp synthetase/RelA/SpoT-type nucleotidyltranferase